jgi:hypothetical protein
MTRSSSHGIRHRATRRVGPATPTCCPTAGWARPIGPPYYPQCPLSPQRRWAWPPGSLPNASPPRVSRAAAAKSACRVPWAIGSPSQVPDAGGLSPGPPPYTKSRLRPPRRHFVPGSVRGYASAAVFPPFRSQTVLAHWHHCQRGYDLCHAGPTVRAAELDGKGKTPPLVMTWTPSPRCLTLGAGAYQRPRWHPPILAAAGGSRCGAQRLVAPPARLGGTVT